MARYDAADAATALAAVCFAFFPAVAGAQAVPAGKAQFQARCARCHGDDGTGGDRGPGIVNPPRPRATSPAAVRDLIRAGIPNAGMPAFPLAQEELDAITAFVMSLRAPGPAPSPSDAAPGDAPAGEKFFAGKGNCASCHMVQGRGGVLGPDLSNEGRDRTPVQMEQALRDPGSLPPVAAGRGGRGAGAPPSYRAVTVRLRNGQTIQGIARNESPFDLQLLGIDGQLHLLRKDQVA